MECTPYLEADGEVETASSIRNNVYAIKSDQSKYVEVNLDTPSEVLGPNIVSLLEYVLEKQKEAWKMCQQIR